MMATGLGTETAPSSGQMIASGAPSWIRPWAMKSSVIPTPNSRAASPRATSVLPRSTCMFSLRARSNQGQPYFWTNVATVTKTDPENSGLGTAAVLPYFGRSFHALGADRWGISVVFTGPGCARGPLSRFSGAAWLPCHAGV